MRLFSEPSQQASPASSSPLRRLIRCKATQAFLTNQGTWTGDIREACAFAGTIAAVQAATSQFPKEYVEVYYSFEPDKPSVYDFTLGL